MSHYSSPPPRSPPPQIPPPQPASPQNRAPVQQQHYNVLPLHNSRTGLSTSLSYHHHFSPSPSSPTSKPPSPFFSHEMPPSKPGAELAPDRPVPLPPRRIPSFDTISSGSMSLPSRRHQSMPTETAAMAKERAPMVPLQLQEQEKYDGTCVQYNQTHFSVSDLVQQSAILPMKAEIATSLYGVCGEASLLDGQVINFHFVKETEVVNLRTRHDAGYKIPLHTSIQFGALYDPQGDTNKALKGYWFQTIADVVNTNPVPHMLYVSKSSCPKDGSTESTVREGEVIVLLSIKTMSSKPVYLKCYSIQAEKVKRLPLECTGPFTTTPILLRMYLTRLLEHLTLPHDVLIFLNAEQQSQMPIQFEKSPVSLVSQEKMVSIIATTEPSTEASYDEPASKLVEIASGLNLEFDQLTMSPEETAKLDHYTIELFRTFSPTMVNCFVDDIAPGGHETQTLLNSYFIEGIQGFHLHTPGGAFARKRFSREQHGEMVHSVLEVCTEQPSKGPPSALGNPLFQKLVPKEQVHSRPLSTAEDKHDQPPHPPSPRGRSSRKPRALSTSEYEYVDMDFRQQEAIQRLTEELRTLTSTCTQLKAELDNVKRRLRVVERQGDMLQQLQLDVKGLEEKQLEYQEFFPAGTSPQHSAAAGGAAEENRRLLRSLSSEQMLQVLEGMGMSAYMEVFYRENINGELLVELNDTILEKEIGIVSQDHRAKLMQLISGMQSVRSYVLC